MRLLISPLQSTSAWAAHASRRVTSLTKGFAMQSKHMVVALVVVNVALLLLQAAHGRPNPAGAAQDLKVRSLELVDDQGRVRAELKVYPAQPNLKMPDGTTGYPEAVQFRLITSQGA